MADPRMETWGRAFSDEELLSMQEQNNWNHFEASLFKTCQRLRSDNERQAEALEMFRDEQQRDKANLLTPEEAHHALDQIPDNQCGWPPKNCPVCDSLREKRRRRADTGVHP